MYMGLWDFTHFRFRRFVGGWASIAERFNGYLHVSYAIIWFLCEVRKLIDGRILEKLEKK